MPRCRAPGCTCVPPAGLRGVTLFFARGRQAPHATHGGDVRVSGARPHRPTAAYRGQSAPLRKRALLGRPGLRWLVAGPGPVLCRVRINAAVAASKHQPCLFYVIVVLCPEFYAAVTADTLISSPAPVIALPSSCQRTVIAAQEGNNPGSCDFGPKKVTIMDLVTVDCTDHILF